MADWRPAFPLLFIAAFLIFEYLIVVPYCVISGGAVPAAFAVPSNLKVIIVSDLLLKGSDAGYVDAIFRNTLFSRFFKKSYEKLEPDMFVVLGDVAAKRAELKEKNWSAVMKQFYRLIGPFGEIPLVFGLGERDVGECCELDQEFVGEIAGKLPGLDRTGCAAFKFENVSFVLINAVALLCNENALRFGVEKLIESESFDLRAQFKDSVLQAGGSDEINKHSGHIFTWKSNPPPSGSGPVVLLHFPLYRAAESNYESSNILCENLQSCECKGTRHVDHRSNIVEAATSNLMQALPSNVTEYILQSLRPRVVFSAHRQHFYDYNHSDGTREVTVPAMTWASSGRPGFVFVTFGKNNMRVSHCSLAGERHVMMCCLSIFILLVSVIVISRGSCLISLF